MEFRQCSIAGIAYADAVEESKRARVIDGVEVGLHDFKKLKSNLRNHSTANVINEFLTLLAVCHTVIPEGNEKNINGKFKFIIYTLIRYDIIVLT